MKLMTTLMAAGLSALALTGCETSDAPYGGAINEGPVRGGGGVVVIDRSPGYREPVREPVYRDDRRYDRRDGDRYDRRADGRPDRYDRDRDRRDPCLGRPGYDPRYDRCDR